MPVQTAMWTNISVTCKKCGSEIPVRVNALDRELMKEAGVYLADLLQKHIERDHA